MEDIGQDKKNSLIPKIAVGIGIAAAGAFIAKKLFRRDGGEDFAGQEVNPVLQDIGEKRGMQLFIKSGDERVGVHVVTPIPKDYYGSWNEKEDSDDKRLFEKALQKREEYKFNDALETARQLLSAGVSGNEKTAVFLLAGSCHYNQYMFEEAADEYQKALDESTAIGDREGEAASAGNLALAYIQRFSLEKARRHAEEALKTYKELKNRANEADQLSNIALMYRRGREFDKALKAQEEALKKGEHSWAQHETSRVTC